MAGRKELDRGASELPALAEPFHRRRWIAFGSQLGEKQVVEPETALVGRLRPEKAARRERGRGDPRGGSRTRMQALGPRAVEHRLHRSACERESDALRLLELLAIESHQPPREQRARHRAADRSRVEADFLKSAV